MKRPRVLLADDHVLVAEGIAKIIETRYQVVGLVSDGKGLLKSVMKFQPDMVLLDISLPVINGFEAAQRIRKISPTTKIVFVTMHDEAPFVKEALLLGVSGYLLKRASAAELLKGMAEALKGKSYFSPMVHPAMPISCKSPIQRKRRLKAHSPLTPRQRVILQMTAEGFSNKGIAQTLSLSLKTVEFHKANLVDRLGMKSTAELTHYALKRKLMAF